jgi:hypothetical protein
MSAIPSTGQGNETGSERRCQMEKSVAFKPCTSGSFEHIWLSRGQYSDQVPLPAKTQPNPRLESI